MKYYRDAPEQLGLHEEDIARLRAKREKLADEKKNREKKLRDLKAAVQALWQKLGVDQGERKAFMNANRGCGVRQINEFEDELARLNELKHANLHLFVEDARCKLQELWDALYFSEDEMLEFTPAFSDVYSDALLEAHEREMARLEALHEQRAPTLALVEKHMNLIKEQRDLEASAKDASRLMTRGQKGERRDPGKLLREEKMRKRISKELPKVSAELRKVLDRWEDEYGRPFVVHGERYLDEMDGPGPSSKSAPSRSRTPGVPASASKPTKPAPGSAPVSRTNSTVSSKPAPPSRNMTKTPTAPPSKRGGNAALKGNGSPSRIPARAPLGNLKYGSNSPERPRPDSRAGNGTLRGAPLLRAPPPKMRDLNPAPTLETPVNPYKAANMGSIVRQVEPEDVYDEHAQRYTGSNHSSDMSHSSHYSHNENRGPTAHASMRVEPSHAVSYPQAPPPRQISGTSHASNSTAVSGSENWETYDDNSEPEMDASNAYYAKLRATRAGATAKRSAEPEGHHHGRLPHGGSQSKRLRGVPPTAATGYGGYGQQQVVMIDGEGNRIISGSEWTDESAF